MGFIGFRVLCRVFGPKPENPLKTLDQPETQARKQKSLEIHPSEGLWKRRGGVRGLEDQLGLGFSWPSPPMLSVVLKRTTVLN